MGIGNFLKQTAGAIGRGVNWLNTNPIASGILRQVPGVGMALRAAQPIAQIAAKAYGGEKLGLSDAETAIKSGREVYNAGKEAISQGRKLASNVGKAISGALGNNQSGKRSFGEAAGGMVKRAR